MKILWTLFIAGQILSAGNMNYQQEMGYYEINPFLGKHPSRERVYIGKVLEAGVVYGLTKGFPEKKKDILIAANFVEWGFIITDRMKGIKFRFRW